MTGKCPFGKVKCEECVLYRRGLRYFEDNRKPEPFEGCAINHGIDCMENLLTRSIGNQKAIEQTRNEVAKLLDLFSKLSQKRLVE